MIRLMTENDADIFKGLLLKAIIDTPTCFVANYDEEFLRPEREICNTIRPTDSQCLFGKFNGPALLGMVGLRRQQLHQSRHKACIWGLFVEPVHRGTGIGRHLLNTVISRARSQGVLQIHLCVNADNRKAKNLYTSSGFERYGIEPRALYAGSQFYDDEYFILRLDHDVSIQR